MKECINKRKAKSAIERKYKRAYIFSFICVLISFLLISNIDTNNVENKEENKIDFNLLGSGDETLTINTKYEDKGVEFKLNDKVLNLNDLSYNIENNIDEKNFGDYNVIYKVNYSNSEYTLVRNVKVVDDLKPTITVYTNVARRYSCGKEKKLYYDFNAFDNYDGDLTDKVEVNDLGDHLVLSVVDSSGNREEVSVSVTDSSPDFPVLSLNGKKRVYVSLNSEYIDEGIKITNGCDIDMGANIQSEGSVDTANEGVYTIKYIDADTNSYLERFVTVYKNNSKFINDEIEEKKVYLTFDDGPGIYTEELLDILDKYNVKATFFVTNQFKKYVPLIEREAKSNHVVAVHTSTHSWKIYKSVENYLKDFNEMNDIIYQHTGKKAQIFRFPGGGSNKVSRGHSTGIMGALSSKMTDLGYTYFDWNVDSEDAAGADSKKIYRNVINGIESRNYSVVLMHDIKRNTIDVIEDIIKYGLDNGYTFDVLSNESPTVHHHINN